jgi:ribonuclease D
MEMKSLESSDLITEEDEFRDVCATLAGGSWVGLDTEFLRERTYFAKLCLVQLSSEGFECAIDVLAMQSLKPLEELLDGGTQKVLHAARQDFEVLYQSCGALPEPAFDTQLAAAFCGFPDQIGYAGLVAEEMGVALSKQQTRTDWSPRPLTAAQMEYALADVQYLGELRSRLEARLDAGGKRGWFEEEMLTFLDREFYEVNPANSYLRVKAGGRLDGPARVALQALAAWRENSARNRDLPRSWVVSDADLVALARLSPCSVDEVSRCEGLKPGFVKRHGKQLVDAVQSALENPEQAELPPAARILTSAERKHSSALMQEVAARAAELDMAPSLLATRRDVEALVRAGDDTDAVEACAVMAGWRKDVIGPVLLP